MTAIACSFDDITPIGFHCLPQDGVMAGKHGLHSLRMLFPQAGTALNVGKQKGDSTGWNGLFQAAQLR
jgi:hypothetical protein